MNKIKQFFLKRKLQPRWKLILLSLVCVFVGINIQSSDSIYDIWFILFIIGYGGYELLFKKED